MPALLAFLDFDESMWLCEVCSEVKMIARFVLTSNDFSLMRINARKNAIQAMQLFTTRWCPQTNKCGVLDCQRRCGLWMPGMRDGGFRRQFVGCGGFPAPVCDPPILVESFIKKNPGPWI